MRVISRKALIDFWRSHPDAETPLRGWFKATTKGTFKNLAELKRTFSSVDYVRVEKKEFYVFNLGGNKFRLIAAIHFNTRRLFVQRVLTHKEYDQGGWKQ